MIEKTVLESERLILKNITENHLEDFFEYRSIPELATYQTWESFDRQEALDYIIKFKDSVPGIPGEWAFFGMFLKSNGKLIGDCSIKTQVDEPRNGEIGGTLSKTYQGQGFAHEAFTTLVDFAFSKMDLHRIIGIADARNTASIKLMERLGMRKEGHFIQNIWFKGTWGDEVQYAILKEEWLKTKKD